MNRQSPDAKSAEKLDKSAEKMRHSAESEARRTTGPGDESAKAKHETAAAEAYSEVARSEHSKGRPAGGDDVPGSRRPSNAGNDGP